jgi:uncharacterized hydrophobic protein (TIGR00271 family)
MPTAPSPERPQASPGIGGNEEAGVMAAPREALEGAHSDAAVGATQSQHAIRDAIRAGAGFDGPFVLSNLAATVIATAGLLGDSAVTVIGAMLIATLTGPIMGVGLALVDYDDRLLWRALRTLLAGTTMVVGVALVLGHLVPPMSTTSEMLSRTSPRLVDLVVALVSGAICAYALTTPRLNAAVFGVAIAVALVPPLATTGLFIARAEWDLAGGAFLLAFVNIVAIQVGTSATLWLRGFRGRRTVGRRRVDGDLRRQAVSLMLMTALAITLGTHGLKLIRQRTFEDEVRASLRSALVSRPEARLVDLTFTTRSGQIVATAVVRSTARFTSADVAELERRLPPSPAGWPVRLTVRHVAIDVVSDEG